jgi:hypothetical protein
MGDSSTSITVVVGIPPPQMSLQLAVTTEPLPGSDDPWSDNYVRTQPWEKSKETWDHLIANVTQIIRHYGTDKEGKYVFDREDGRKAGEPMPIALLDRILQDRGGRYPFPPLTKELAKEMIEKEYRFSPIMLENPRTKEMEACIACARSKRDRRHRPLTM